MSSRGSYSSGYYSNGAFFNRNAPLVSYGNNQRDYQKPSNPYGNPFGSSTSALYRSSNGTYINTCNGSYRYVGPKSRNQQHQV